MPVRALADSTRRGSFERIMRFRHVWATFFKEFFSPSAGAMGEIMFLRGSGHHGRS
jgi:hypothetical protein